MDTLEYPFIKGARSSLLVVAILCIVLVVAIPVALWVLWRLAVAKVIISSEGVIARGLGATEFAFRDVARLGVCHMPIVARGIGGVLVKRRVGGNTAVHVVIKTNAGKQKNFIVSSYEKADEIMAKISERLAKPYEKVETGFFGMKWPEVK